MACSLTDIVFAIKPFSVGEGDEKVTLTCADKAVLNVLAHRADRETHICWPGHRVISEGAILSRQQVIDSIKKLNKWKYSSPSLSVATTVRINPTNTRST